MSLVGSLEDLGLVDILQIVSLSRKSGLLSLLSDSGSGRIVLRDGMVQGAAVKGEIESLRELLVGTEEVDPDAFDRAASRAGGDVDMLDRALAGECGLEAEKLEQLRREQVERCVMRMFGWRTGEFSFEIRDDFADGEQGLLLHKGLNTQYLAMEATRLGDETTHEALGAEPGDSNGDTWDEPMFSGEEGEASPSIDSDSVAEIVEEPVFEVSEGNAGAVDAMVAASVLGVEAGEAVTAESQESDSVAPAAALVEPAEARTRRAVRILIAVDRNLSTLEWMKASLDGLFQRVHIFQNSELAVDRVRQYLLRGEVPLLLVADGACSSEGEDATFVKRLRTLAPHMPILSLKADGSGDEFPAAVDGAVFRPSSPSADPERWHRYQAVADRLRDDLLPWRDGERTRQPDGRSQRVLDRLKRTSDRLRDPASQGEVLNLVLGFAAETFARVAVFMVRDDTAQGMAGRGLQATGGPEDAALTEFELDGERMPELFRDVMERRVALRSPFLGPNDRELAARLGATAPGEVYAAPIESGGCVVALVYGDNLPDERPLPDTTAFEIVLHEAGLALDRALLERALSERS